MSGPGTKGKSKSSTNLPQQGVRGLIAHARGVQTFTPADTRFAATFLLLWSSPRNAIRRPRDILFSFGVQTNAR